MKPGTRVLISTNLDKTYKYFGSATNMEEMKGRYFLIKDSYPNENKYRIAYKEHTYIFSGDDLTEAIESKEDKKPKLFDCNELVLK